MGVDPRVIVRDQLLDAIVGHLRYRDAYLAQLVERITGVVRANNDWIEDSSVSADVSAFAEMDLRRGKAKSWGPLHKAKLQVETSALYLRTALSEIPKDTTENRQNAVQEAWRSSLRQHDSLTTEQLTEVLGEADTGAMAMRLVFLATRSGRHRQERFEDFRRQVNRQKLRAHPWIVRDSK
jgi:hypothetical protein